MNSKITFRPLSRDDFPTLHEWLNTPAVKKWWCKPSTPKAIEKKYGPRIDGKSATTCFVVSIDNKTVGMVQSYWVKDYPDYAKEIKYDNSVGMDWLIGEKEYLGKGLGPAIAKEFVKNVISKKYSNSRFAVASPSINNERSIRALEKAGFNKGRVINLPDEDDPEQLMVLPL